MAFFSTQVFMNFRRLFTIADMRSPPVCAGIAFTLLRFEVANPGTDVWSFFCEVYTTIGRPHTHQWHVGHSDTIQVPLFISMTQGLRYKAYHTV